MMKYKRILVLTFIFIGILGLKTTKVDAVPYYDIRFEKISERQVKGEYEILGEKINLKEDAYITMLIQKSYNTNVNISMTKDEEDAISQIYGSKWNQATEISKEEGIDIKGNVDNYVQVRPVYKEIKGYLVKDYNSWNKKKEITILIPIDVEYNIKN